MRFAADDDPLSKGHVITLLIVPALTKVSTRPLTCPALMPLIVVAAPPAIRMTRAVVIPVGAKLFWVPTATEPMMPEITSAPALSTLLA